MGGVGEMKSLPAMIADTFAVVADPIALRRIFYQA
jgi:hypothetical protein